MRIICFIALLLNPCLSWSESFFVNGRWIDFSSFEGTSVLWANGQVAANGHQALVELKKKDKIVIPQPTKYISSMGSAYCKYVWKQPSLLGKNKQGDQRSFCVFADDSIIELNSLSSYLATKKVSF